MTVSGDTVQAAPGTGGPSNLAELCRRAEPEALPPIVEHHFDALDNATRSASA